MHAKVVALTDEEYKTQVESVTVKVGEKDFNLRMENDRYWEEIATTFTYMFDRQERELAALAVLTLADFKEHFNNLFFDSEKTKRFDL